VFRSRETQHFQDDLVFRSGSLSSWVADIDAVAKYGSIHADKSLPIALKIGADELPRGPLEHLQDLARRTEIAAVRLARDPHQPFIAGRCVEGRLFADEDLWSGVSINGMRPHEAGAGGGAAEDPRHGAMRLRWPNRVVAAESEPLLVEQI